MVGMNPSDSLQIFIPVIHSIDPPIDPFLPLIHPFIHSIPSIDSPIHPFLPLIHPFIHSFHCSTLHVSNKHTLFLFYIITRRRTQFAVRERSTCYFHSTPHCANDKKATVSLKSTGNSCTCVNPITFPLLLNNYPQSTHTLSTERSCCKGVIVFFRSCSGAFAITSSNAGVNLHKKFCTQFGAEYYSPLSILIAYHRISFHTETKHRRNESARKSADPTSVRPPRSFYSSPFSLIRTASSQTSFHPIDPSEKSTLAAD